MAGAGPTRRQDGGASAEEGGARSGGSGAAEAVSARPQSPATRPGSPWVGTRLSAAQARPSRPQAGTPAGREHRAPPARAGSTSAKVADAPRGSPHTVRASLWEGPCLSRGNGYKRWISDTQKTKLASPHVETVNVCVFYKRGPGVSLSEDAERLLRGGSPPLLLGTAVPKLSGLRTPLQAEKLLGTPKSFCLYLLILTV